MEIFNDSINKITNAYQELNLKLGWRFLYSPEKTLSLNPNIIFIGLNPGGSKFSNPIKSVELGNAFRVEKWGIDKFNDLQTQVIILFEKISCQLNNKISLNDFMDNILTVNFCPFRSSSWEKMENKADVIKFSYQLWLNLFSFVKPKIIICMDGKVFNNLKSIFNDLGYDSIENKTILSGWGNVKIEIEKVINSTNEISIIRLPHLSRYKIMTSKKCYNCTEEIIKFIVEKLNC